MAATKNLAVRVVEFHPEDPAAGLRVEELAIPAPGEGEYLVRVHLRPVNPSDVGR